MLVVVLYFISVSMNFIRKLVPLTRPVAISLVVVLYFISVSMNFIRKLVPLTRPVAISLATKTHIQANMEKLNTYHIQFMYYLRFGEDA